MKIARIITNDLANGPGIRVSVFTSGCPHHCEGCHNPHLWDYNVGHDLSDKIISQILHLLHDNNITRGLSVLGGEPLAPDNLEGTTALCRSVKAQSPNTNIWIWSGYEFTQIKNFDIIEYVDGIVDGQFIQTKKTGDTLWRGSTNQHIYQKNKDGIFLLTE